LSSPALTFQTAVPEERPFAFAVMGDTESRPHVNNAIAQAIWGQRPNFVINVGDLTDGGQEPRRFEWTHEYFPGVGHLAARVPFFSLPGNGDSDLVWYKRYHSLPGQENYYAVSYGNADFFILDSNRSFAPGSEQYEWLARVLPASDATWKFAAHHHPAYSSDENDYGDTWSGPSNYGDDNVRHLLPLYEENGVDMVFFGHLHTYERSWPIAGGGPVTEGGVIHVQTGGAGGHLEDAAPNRTPFMHTVYRGRHYCMLRIYGGRLEFEMIDMDGRLRDRLVIEK
jgi:3',5'-cyclic AMP phosphodiesterase CpdA